MEQASKRRRLAIEIVLIEESSGDSTQAEVEEINVKIVEDTVLRLRDWTRKRRRIRRKN